MAQIETAPLLSRFARTRQLRDALGGTALVAAVVLLGTWFALAVTPPRPAQAADRAVAIAETGTRS